MRRFKIIAGTLWALSCTVLILILFPGLNSLSGSAARLPFMKINPNYTGGEVARQIVKDNYTIDIRKPVFDGLTGERKNGFVQVDWRGKIPETIADTIDYDLDNKPDFCITINKSLNKSEIKSFNSKAGELALSLPTSYGWAVRVNVKK